jgi:hypothetical protein
MRRLLIAIAASIAGALPGSFVVAGSAHASGTNQYTSGTASSSGLCHGAFANTNGNFGIRGQLDLLSGITGGVPAGPGSAGYDNSAVSGDCTLPSGR